MGFSAWSDPCRPSSGPCSAGGSACQDRPPESGGIPLSCDKEAAAGSAWVFPVCPVAGRGERKAPRFSPRPRGAFRPTPVTRGEGRRGDPGVRNCVETCSVELQFLQATGIPPAVPRLAGRCGPRSSGIMGSARHSGLGAPFSRILPRAAGTPLPRRSAPTRPGCRPIGGARSPRDVRRRQPGKVTDRPRDSRPDQDPERTILWPKDRTRRSALNNGGFSLTSENPLYTVCSTWGEDAPGQSQITPNFTPTEDMAGPFRDRGNDVFQYRRRGHRQCADRGNVGLNRPHNTQGGTS